MENRIKEQQLWLFADRTSTATMRANQLRVYFSAFAGILMTVLRRAGLQGTELATARFDTIRAADQARRIKVSVRRVRLGISEAVRTAHARRPLVAPRSLDSARRSSTKLTAAGPISKCALSAR